ncbi:hypothetical protein ACFFX0_07060 [Citricoccus parietis]|uniref:Uncharacterized protein n=1 Tax=Citricoccus parietis TaxID=592307 RepID=A0ABV5FWB7_9MICC
MSPSRPLRWCHARRPSPRAWRRASHAWAGPARPGPPPRRARSTRGRGARDRGGRPGCRRPVDRSTKGLTTTSGGCPLPSLQLYRGHRAWAGCNRMSGTSLVH